MWPVIITITLVQGSFAAGADRAKKCSNRSIYIYFTRVPIMIPLQANLHRALVRMNYQTSLQCFYRYHCRPVTSSRWFRGRIRQLISQTQARNAMLARWGDGFRTTTGRVCRRLLHAARCSWWATTLGKRKLYSQRRLTRRRGCSRIA